MAGRQARVAREARGPALAEASVALLAWAAASAALQALDEVQVLERGQEHWVWGRMDCLVA